MINGPGKHVAYSLSPSRLIRGTCSGVSPILSQTIPVLENLQRVLSLPIAASHHSLSTSISTVVRYSATALLSPQTLSYHLQSKGLSLATRLPLQSPFHPFSLPSNPPHPFSTVPPASSQPPLNLHTPLLHTQQSIRSISSLANLHAHQAVCAPATPTNFATTTAFTSANKP